MNNSRGVMTSLFTVGAASAIIYGVTRGIRNGTLQNTASQQGTKQLISSLQNNVDNNQSQTAGNNLNQEVN